MQTSNAAQKCCPATQLNSAAQHSTHTAISTADISQAHLQHDSVHDVSELVSGAFGKEGDVGPGISQHKLLGRRQAAVEAVDEGAQEAHPLQAQHHQSQSQSAPTPDPPTLDLNFLL